jgi:hypothetical protein
LTSLLPMIPILRAGSALYSSFYLLAFNLAGSFVRGLGCERLATLMLGLQLGPELGALFALSCALGGELGALLTLGRHWAQSLGQCCY